MPGVNEAGLLAALLIGLTGSPHCAGMCGGIIGAFTLGIAPGRHPLAFQLAYNGGRILGYTSMGALAGLLAGSVTERVGAPLAIGHWLSGLFLIVLGLHLAGWWRGLAYLERAGAHLWRRIEPLGRRLLPVSTPAHALALGLVWGWLPCGMVYAALAGALAQANALDGALWMAAFGLGTLPMTLALGAGAHRIAARPLMRRIAGVLMIALAITTLVAPGAHNPHHHNGDDTQVTGALPR
jgi:sulfite exporter TauE/SafE